MRDLLALSEIARAAAGSRPVRWLTGDGRIVQGTARSVGDERGNILNDDEDVRDGYLRVTLTVGLDVFRPISDVVAQLRDGEFVID